MVTISKAQPARGFQAGNLYVSTGTETVNTTNGNLMLNIPIASLPAGRGGSPGYTVTLQYNSKLWDPYKRVEPGLNDIGGNQRYYTATELSLSPRAGWDLHSSYRLMIDDQRNYSPDCDPNDPQTELSFFWKVEIVMPDGTVRQFFPETGRSSQIGTWENGYSNIDHNGVRHLRNKVFPSEYSCYITQSTSQVTTGGMTYVSMDGSQMRLVIPYQPSIPTYNQRNWKLYFPDGTLVENLPTDNPAVAQRMTDRNGNNVEHVGNKIIDQLGRYIEFTSDASPGTIIRTRGVGGEVVDVRLISGGRWVRRQYTKASGPYVPPAGMTGILEATFSAVEQIIFPAQLGSQSMQFEYYASTTNPGTTETEGWGQIKKITLPTGATSNYQYSVIGLNADSIVEGRAGRKDLKYTEQYDGGQPVERTDTWLYGLDNKVTSPNGAVIEERVIGYPPYPAPPWDNRLSYKSINPDGSIVERIWGHNLPFSITGTAPATPGGWSGIGAGNAYVKTELTTLADINGNITSSSPTAIKDYEYDKNGNLLEVKEYDWVTHGSIARNNDRVTNWQSSGAVLKRKTVNTYYNQAANASSATANSYSYSDSFSPKLKNVIKSTEIQDGSSTPVSRSEFYYDDPDNKGNLVETRVWDSTKGTITYPLTTSNSISSTAQYDQYGNVTLATDAKGNQTHITYGSINGFTGLYPTQTIAAYATSIARTSTAAYDFYTGLATTATDVDNNVSVVTEYDALGRATKVRNAANTPLESWTRTEYSAAERRVIVRSDLETIGDGKKVAVQHYDQLGRVRLSRSLENIATEDPYNEQHGIKVQTRYRYDNGADPLNSNGTYTLTSNPYRAAVSSAATNEQTMGWALGYSTKTAKHGETTTYSGAALPGVFGGSNSNSTGVVKTDIDSDRTLVTGQAGKQRISRTNALGRLKDVWEVTASDQWTEPISFPNQTLSAGYRTSYSYDTLNNLTTVSQGVQTRSFAYSSLSRLLSATNPESGTIGYLYDNNGNLTQKTDAKLILTNYIYDALNRVTNRNYTAPAGLPNYQATPNVTYTYDNLTNAKGKLIKVSSSVSTTEYTAFDILGRVTGSKQTTDGVTYGNGATDNLMTYSYNLSGALIEQQYPSGRKVQNTLDASGDLEMVSSRKNANAGYWAYANNFTYNAAGAVTAMQLGNGTWESTAFNSRLQPTQIALGVTQGATGLLKLDYTYGTTANNGNVLSQTITVPGLTHPFVQTYNYDSLNRLDDSNETYNGGQTWRQDFSYDRYGNRNFVEANTSMGGISQRVQRQYRTVSGSKEEAKSFNRHGK